MSFLLTPTFSGFPLRGFGSLDFSLTRSLLRRNNLLRTVVTDTTGLGGPPRTGSRVALEDLRTLANPSTHAPETQGVWPEK